MGRILNANRYATITSTLALIIALGGGTAYAADLITSRDIKNGGVKRVDIASGAINSAKVADGTLLKGDFAAGQIPAGPQGPAGPAGPAGVQGQTGPQGPTGPVALNYVAAGTFFADPGEQVSADVDCPSGQSVTGGGVGQSSPDVTASINSSHSIDNESDADSVPNNGWAVDINNGSATRTLFSVYAICTPATSVSFSFGG